MNLTKNKQLKVCSLIKSNKDDLHSLNCENFDSLVALINAEIPSGCPVLLGLNQADLYDNENLFLNWFSKRETLLTKVILLSDKPLSQYQNPHKLEEKITLLLPENANQEMKKKAFENLVAMLRQELYTKTITSKLELSYEDIHNLTEVGHALSSEKDFDKLIELILWRAIKLTYADVGSIYLTERKKNNEPATHIRFKKSAMDLKANEFLLPINKNSIAGYVAYSGEHLFITDCYRLSGQEDYHFNSEFDKKHNYYTKSMLVIPMKNHQGNVIGIIQLINRKKDSHAKVTIEQIKSDQVIAFDETSYELGMALAGQAAVAIENNRLVQDIQQLFESFVKASVTAIEQRDPTTSGHSFRVAEFTCRLASAVDKSKEGDFKDFRLEASHMRELRYAGLLHDFGKVGVRETVLVKAKKLFPHELENIKWRFYYLKKQIENDSLKKKLNFLKSAKPGYSTFEKQADHHMQQKLTKLKLMLEFLMKSNEPTVLEAGDFDFLNEIAQVTIDLEQNKQKKLITVEELKCLSIRKGTLSREEREEIESHVTKTYQFLIQIPWTHDLSNVPQIAYGHHEKLDGTGYPLNLEASKISVQTRMMTISDIYDALTAWDRPYKKALSFERAINILKEEVDMGHVDGRLLDIFIESKAWDIEGTAYQNSKQ